MNVILTFVAETLINFRAQKKSHSKLNVEFIQNFLVEWPRGSFYAQKYIKSVNICIQP